MKYNCLTYLLDLWKSGHRFKLLYNGSHCVSANEKRIFELGNEFKKDLMRGFSARGSNEYTPIELWHSKETIKKIFNLNEEDYKSLEEYYELNKIEL